MRPKQRFLVKQARNLGQQSQISDRFEQRLEVKISLRPRRSTQTGVIRLSGHSRLLRVIVLTTSVLALEGGALNAQLAWGQQARTAMAFVGHGGGFDPRITDPSGDQTDSNEIPIDGAGITADYVDPTVLDPRITDPPGNEIDPAEVSALGHVDNGGTVDPAQDPTDQPVNKQNVFPSTIGDPIFEARHMDPRITDPADVIDSQDEGLNNSILEKAVE